jgi:hypothetical protein
MIEKTINTRDEKLIRVYDDVFSYQEKCNLFRFFRSSLYRSDSGDNNSEDQIYSNFSTLDVENSGIKNIENFKKIINNFDLANKNIKQIRVNLTTPAEKNRIHSDGFGITLIYYANLEWELDWGGHTLFLEETLQEARYVCFYKPGRIVVFDGSIPHMIMTPSNLCPTSRYSFVIQFH